MVGLTVGDFLIEFRIHDGPLASILVPEKNLSCSASIIPIFHMVIPSTVSKPRKPRREQVEALLRTTLSYEGKFRD
jgi:hypothetical protein